MLGGRFKSYVEGLRDKSKFFQRFKILIFFMRKIYWVDHRNDATHEEGRGNATSKVRGALSQNKCLPTLQLQFILL